MMKQSEEKQIFQFKIDYWVWAAIKRQPRFLFEYSMQAQRVLSLKIANGQPPIRGVQI